MEGEIGQLIRFVPRFIQERLGKDPSVPSGFTADVCDAFVLFADISGFTPLSIQLAEIGPEGAEELDCVLNEYYGRLVQIIDQWGGDVVAFAGDAAICVWPYTTSGAESESEAVAQRVARCALQIQQELHEYSVRDEIRLSVRISVTSGSLTFTNVGGMGQHWHPMVVGEALDQLGRVSDAAQKGDIVLDAKAQAMFAPNQLEGRTLDHDFLLLTGLKSPPTPQAAFSPPKTVASIQDAAIPALRSFIPPIVLSRLAVGQAEWLADLRNLTVIFVRLRGIPVNAGGRFEMCQLSMLRFQKAMHRFEGDVIHFLQDDKGMIAVLCFGLPPNLHEEDALLAIRAASDIQSSLQGLGISSDIGISSGRIFSGIRGGRERCEYSITGHIVNLAARLMSKADGGILCDNETKTQTRGAVQFAQVPDLDLKGIPHPVPAFRPDTGQSIGRQNRLQQDFIVGRATEVQRMHDWLQERNDQLSSVLMLQGEAGIGKSLLLSELGRMAHHSSLSVYSNECDVVERATPYFVWRAVLREIVEADSLAAEELESRVAQLCRNDPTQVERLALLNPFLDSDFTESPVVAQLSSEARAALTQDLVIQVLDEVSRHTPILLVLDDVQWMDSLSWGILAAIPNRLSRVSVALGARPFSDADLPDAHQLLQSSRTLRLELGNLDQPATEAQVCRILDLDQLAPQLGKFLFERSQGNPFFVQELVYFLSESNLIEIVGRKAQLRVPLDASAADQAQIPTSMRALITRRVDRLKPAQQMTIKTASIVGRSFAKKTLLAIYQVDSERGKLDEHLDQILELRLIQVEDESPDTSYFFQHLTVQQVVYDQIPARNRRSMHLSIARWYEQTRGENPSFYPLLAYHWGQAQVIDKEIEFLAKSADEALKRYANHEVISNLTLALQRTEEMAEDAPNRPTDKQIGHWYRQMGEAQFQLGELSDARDVLQDALGRFGIRLPKTKPRQLLGMTIHMGQQTARLFLPSFMINHRVVPKSEDSAGGLQEAAQALQRLSQIHYFQVDVILGFSRAIWAINLAERAGRSPLLAQAYAGMALVTGMLRMHPIAKMYAKLALKVSGELGHLPTTSYCLMATAVYRLGLGQWSQVRKLAQESIEAAKRLADQRLLAEAITVDAMCSCFLGDHFAGSKTYSELKQVSDRSENTVHIGWSHSGLGECQFRQGATEEALKSFEKALQVLEDSEHTTEEIRMLGMTALGHWRLRRKSAAVAFAKKALPIARESFATVSTLEGIAGIAVVLVDYLRADPHDEEAQELARSAIDCLKTYSKNYRIGTSRYLAIYAQLLRILDRPRKAAKVWQKSIYWAQQHELPYDEAFAHWSFARYGVLEDDDQEHHRTQARELFQKLGCLYELGQIRSNGQSLLR